MSIRLGVLLFILLAPPLLRAEQEPTSAPPAARVMLLGTFHVDNPGFDSVEENILSYLAP